MSAETSLRRVLDKLRERSQNQATQAELSATQSQQTVSDNAISTHANKRQTHGTYPYNIAKTTRSDQWVDWKDLKNVPDLALAAFDLDDLGQITPTVNSLVKTPADSVFIDDGWLSDAIMRVADLTWTNVTGKPSTFPPSAHTHPFTEITGVITSTQHGSQPGGSLHAVATDSVLGFVKVDGTTILIDGSGTLSSVGTGTGDMLKAIYDIDNDGIVDAADVAASALSAPWAGLTGVPSTFTPSSHTHPTSDITGVISDAQHGSRAGGSLHAAATASVLGFVKPDGSTIAVDGSGNISVIGAPWSGLTGVPSTFTPSAHTHPTSDITGVISDAQHGSRGGGTLHAAATASVIGFVKPDGSTTAVDGSGNISVIGAPWSGLTGIPSTFTPSAHTHPFSDVTGTLSDAQHGARAGGTLHAVATALVVGFMKPDGATTSVDGSGNITVIAAPWSGLTGVPSTFTPASHTHPFTDITGVITDVQHGARGGGTLHAAATNSVLGFVRPDTTTISQAAGVLSAIGVPWSGITSKPTTIAGYGITDLIITGTGSSGQVPYYTGAQALSGDSGFLFDSSTKRLTLPGDILVTKGGGGVLGPGIYLESTSSGAVDSELIIAAAGVGSSTSSDGPLIVARGNSFTRTAGQRGALYIITGAPTTPTSDDGALFLYSGATQLMKGERGGGIALLDGAPMNPNSYSKGVAVRSGTGSGGAAIYVGNASNTDALLLGHSNSIATVWNRANGSILFGTNGAQRWELGATGILWGSNQSISLVDRAAGTVADDVQNGVYWHQSSGVPSTSYSIRRSSGTWSAPNYQQMILSWDTGIILDAGSGTYGKSYIEERGNVRQVSGGAVFRRWMAGGTSRTAGQAILRIVLPLNGHIGGYRITFVERDTGAVTGSSQHFAMAHVITDDNSSSQGSATFGQLVSLNRQFAGTISGSNLDLRIQTTGGVDAAVGTGSIICVEAWSIGEPTITLYP